MNRHSSRSLIIRSLLIIGVTCLAFSAPFSASAHGDEARVQLSVTQAQPGTTIEVRGSGFEPDDQTAIMLVGTNRLQLFGSATTDADGNLAQAVLLPVDATDGLYEVRVTGAHHVAGAALHIMTDLNGDEAGSQRAEEEPLLAPMPIQVPGTGHSSAVPVVNKATSLPTREEEPPISTTLLFSSALAAVILVAGLVVILRRFR